MRPYRDVQGRATLVRGLPGTLREEKLTVSGSSQDRTHGADNGVQLVTTWRQHEPRSIGSRELRRKPTCHQALTQQLGSTRPPLLQASARTAETIYPDIDRKTFSHYPSDKKDPCHFRNHRLVKMAIRSVVCLSVLHRLDRIGRLATRSVPRTPVLAPHPTEITNSSRTSKKPFRGNKFSEYNLSLGVSCF